MGLQFCLHKVVAKNGDQFTTFFDKYCNVIDDGSQTQTWDLLRIMHKGFIGLCTDTEKQR